ncbi:hypothetical protein N7540_012679 [Penicillium herquei]|nr:hypothetical protein N7540_012679 [Penicillium herquei]
MTKLTNTGDGPLQVPGFGSIPLDFQLPQEAHFASGLMDYRHTPRLTKREMAMIRLMQHITEQPGWDEAILNSDEAHLAKWYRNATEEPEGGLISAAAWDWCLKELRDKADLWQKTGRLMIFDSSSVVCQADILPGSDSSTLKTAFQEAIARLGPQRSHDSPLVDPSMYPLAYGRSPVLIHGGQVSLDNLWGKGGEITGELPPDPLESLEFVRRQGLQNYRDTLVRLYRKPGYGGPESCWSNRFQWLPCEFQFRSASGCSDVPDLQITSYVNNLHPGEHNELYRCLERLVTHSVPSWNEVLFYGNTRGRCAPRILTYGCKIENYMEENKMLRTLFPMLQWKGQCETYEEWQELRETVREYVEGPEPPKWKQVDPLPNMPANLSELLTPEEWDIPKQVHRIARLKRTRRAWFEHPEPGVSFSYDQWKRGEFTGRAIHPQRISRFPDPLHHEFTRVQLEEQFREDGLQVVVEIRRIELTLESPNYSGESHFHTEGLRNDRIAATTLYVVESKNITKAHLAFQHEDKIHATELECEVPMALSTVLDVDYWNLYEEEEPRALHTFGSIHLREGQTLTWPNTYRTKQEPFSLIDPSQPGNLTLIKLRLVDPNYRICSTRNVPPQQTDWWVDAALKAANLDQRLPPELVRQVIEGFEGWPMSTAEAEALRCNFHADQEHVRKAIDQCVGHHVVLFLPYDEEAMLASREVIFSQVPESP